MAMRHSTRRRGRRSPRVRRTGRISGFALTLAVTRALLTEVREAQAWLCASAIALAGCGADIGSPDEDVNSDVGGSPDAGGTTGGSDAAPRPDAGGDGCVEGWHELLENSNFDQGPDV